MLSSPPGPPPAPGDGDDPYGWLFRQEVPAPVGPHGAPRSVQQPAPLQSEIPTAPQPAVDFGPPRRGSSTPSLPPPSPPAPTPPARRRLGVPVLLLVLAVVLATGIGIGLVWSGRQSTPTGQAATAARGVGPLTPTAVSVGCREPDATDDAGTTVSYAPESTYDGDPATAWRCDGSGVGQQLEFRFGRSVRIEQVGLVNGYAKIDPSSQARRYPEYRRITQVRWTFPDGTSVAQQLADGNETLQTIPVAAQQTDEVTLTIEATTGPGWTGATRDAVLISEVAFSGG